MANKNANTTEQNMPSSGNGSSTTQILSDVVLQLTSIADRADRNASTILANQIEQLRAANQSQSDAVGQNTRALLANTIAQAQSGLGSAIKTAGGVFSQILGGGLGLGPLITGLTHLFGGGQQSTPPPLPAYYKPEAMGFEVSVSPSTNSTTWTIEQGARSLTPVAANPTQINVQVNTMDSKSFMDHSQDIAKAVREAMLNSHSINDVVSDL